MNYVDCKEIGASYRTLYKNVMRPTKASALVASFLRKRKSERRMWAVYIIRCIASWRSNVIVDALGERWLLFARFQPAHPDGNIKPKTQNILGWRQGSYLFSHISVRCAWILEYVVERTAVRCGTYCCQVVQRTALITIHHVTSGLSGWKPSYYQPRATPWVTVWCSHASAL